MALSAAFFSATLFACDGRPGAPPSGPAGGRIPKVLVIGIDGVRPDVLAEVATPNIDALAADGWYSGRTRTASPSVSGPAWSSMLTGVWPEKHGVKGNDFAGRRYDDYPDFLTRMERMRPELSTFAAADWLPLMELEGGDPPISPLVDVRIVLDGYELGWAEADAEIAMRSAGYLADSDPDAAFVYLGNPDETSHRHSSVGAEYREAIGLADAHVGLLVNAVRSRPGYSAEDWLILVSTDHGRRADGSHGGDSPEEMTTFILAHARSATAGPAYGATFIVDVAVTALSHLGIETEPAWGLDGRTLR